MPLTSIGQSSYSTQMTLAVAGQLADLYQDYDIVSYLCSVNVPFGTMVVLDTSTDANGNTVKLPNGTTTTIGTMVGVAMYVDSLEQQLPGTTNTGHLAGTVIPVVRKGRIYALFYAASTLTAITPLGNPNVYHPSDNGTALGVAVNGAFTTDATSNTANQEVTACAAGVRFVRITGLEVASGFGVCLLDINLPNG